MTTKTHSAPRPYHPGNTTDVVKNSNRSCLIDLNTVTPTTQRYFYYEFHSGAGRYPYGKAGTYDGTSFRTVLQFLEKKVGFTAVLNEKEEKSNRALQKNVGIFPGVTIYSNWKSNIKNYIAIAPAANGIFLSDPSFMKDHLEVMPHIQKILATGANLFMYIPEGRGKHYSNQRFFFEGVQNSPERIVLFTRDLVEETGRRAIDLMHPSEKGGARDRIEHNLIVVDDVPILNELERNHAKILRKLVSDGRIGEARFKRFKKENGLCEKINY